MLLSLKMGYYLFICIGKNQRKKSLKRFPLNHNVLIEGSRLLKNHQEKKKLEKKRILNEIASKDTKSIQEKITNVRLSREVDKIRFEAAFKTLLKR